MWTPDFGVALFDHAVDDVSGAGIAGLWMTHFGESRAVWCVSSLGIGKHGTHFGFRSGGKLCNRSWVMAWLGH